MNKNKRPVDAIFWENVYRFIEEARTNVSTAEKKTGVRVGYFNVMRNRGAIPRTDMFMRMAELFDREYIEFFEDWGE